MSKYSALGGFLRSTMLAGAIAALCAPALAQDASDDEQLEEIITTGTRTQQHKGKI